MRALSIAQQRGNSFTENPNHYPPLMLNLGDNNLIPIVNAKYDGQIVGEMDAYLQYPLILKVLYFSQSTTERLKLGWTKVVNHHIKPLRS